MTAGGFRKNCSVHQIISACLLSQLCMLISSIPLEISILHQKTRIPFLSSNCKTLKGSLICQTVSWTLTVVIVAKSDDYQKFLLWTFYLIMAKKNTYYDIYFLKIFKVNSTILL